MILTLNPPSYILPGGEFEGELEDSIPTRQDRLRELKRRASRFRRQRIENQITSDMAIAVDLQEQFATMEMNRFQPIIEIDQYIETHTTNNLTKEENNPLSETLEILEDMSKTESQMTEGKYLELSNLLMKVHNN